MLYKTKRMKYHFDPLPTIYAQLGLGNRLMPRRK